ncbi:efflux RND transporter periplasmic adaptor subunit [uncultured Eudoraea sp.]|jgi:RND family efflux transporter MFP subunit|uniref:efflux RND transporter periplasmic adaptor subunit n=1 Tax=uncultured Eudoraea sp. TaxID=1035614 RepID=UPI00261DB4F0|nr:efflux RND transporter periplasmic adaptor subunit [uncultured Eudoraea sp.]
MKNTLLLILISFLIISCGDGPVKSVETLIAEGNLEAIKLKKQEIAEKQKLLNSELRLLDSVINVKDSNSKLALVTTLKTKEQQFRHYLDLQGNVMTKQNVLIYPEMNGTLVRVYVKEGQKVNKGQLLATIDDGGMSSQLEQLKTQAALAKTTFERQKRLWEQKIGSEIQYLQAETNYQAVENSVKQAQSQLAKSNIRAPFSGIIDNVIQEQGTVVSPVNGQAVFRIVNLSDMYIEVDVPESYLNGVKVGKEVKAYFPVLGDSITSVVRQTGNFINPTNRSFRVEIAVPNKNNNIKPNLTARVQINNYSNNKAILIPQSLISENAEGEQYVYIATEVDSNDMAVAKKQIIKTGLTQGDYVEVIEGINPGEQVIMEGARNVRENQKVKIIQ